MSESTTDKTSEGRNIVLCLDGTGDWLGTGATNVVQIYEALKKDTQLCFYDGGIGTLTDPKALGRVSRTILKLLDLGSATSLREKTLNAYLFLVRNYKPGDRIYLFGFSRGAFTARLLAGMIHNMGLLRSENEHISAYVWQNISQFKMFKAFIVAARRIKNTFSTARKGSPTEQPGYLVEIHFMGLFDSVSSIGVLARFKTYPNTDLNKSVKRVCHAVAMDEQRNVFPEMLFNPLQPGLTEVWFPGVHRDAGGGLPDGKTRIADEARSWIAKEAKLAGLDIDVESLAPDRTILPKPNFSGIDPFVLGGLYPMRTFSKRVQAFRVTWPNYCHLRYVPEGALIHEVAFELKEDPKTNYSPRNWPEKAQRFPLVQESPKRHLLKDIPFNLVDLISIVYAVMMLFLIWNWLVFNPFGPSFSTLDDRGLRYWHWAAFAFGGYLLTQVVGQKVTAKIPVSVKALSRQIVPLIALALSGWFVFVYQHHLVYWGLNIGGVFYALAQFGPWPKLTANRVLPSVLTAIIVPGLLFHTLNMLPFFDVTAEPVRSQNASLSTIPLLIFAVYRTLSDRFTMQRIEARAEDKLKRLARKSIAEHRAKAVVDIPDTSATETEV